MREFTADLIAEADLLKIIEAGRWAPSGLNNQPWKVVVVKNREIIAGLAGCTKYWRVISGCRVCLAVYYDESKGYNETKDILAVGAFIQNMLLTVQELGLGACWLGEILNQENAVNNLLSVPDAYRLMAVIALGNPTAKQRSSTRRPINEIIYKTID